ncbi:uncharacterized protein CC84DRAFT_1091883 [Paraphaeosphaeria sporulosa]|uniref:Uncharacterized protein n=1 Tax=Paraphaeosphaeria sporulosa TaxID=1460663 RepID=A0A177CDG3_9PLEO|nr:uncharacterized protein CC84DRAFT_1091883 [Paraphaeosphaeria sporulosa]OAG05356.1 hypothetical protein CC84DRAFT_1091883 [Paraphaeosphaeria sporulosa]
MEALLCVLVAFIFYKYNRFVFTSGLIHFTTILGINIDVGRLRPIKHYLYLLARVVYYVQVLRAEVLLPVSQHDH